MLQGDIPISTLRDNTVARPCIHVYDAKVVGGVCRLVLEPYPRCQVHTDLQRFTSCSGGIAQASMGVEIWMGKVTTPTSMLTRLLGLQWLCDDLIELMLEDLIA